MKIACTKCQADITKGPIASGFLCARCYNANRGRV